MSQTAYQQALTPAQQVANALAQAAGMTPPFPDNYATSGQIQLPQTVSVSANIGGQTPNNMKLIELVVIVFGVILIVKEMK